MFWIGFLVGILVIPAVAFLVLAVLFSIHLIPYIIKVIKKYFYDKKVKKGLLTETSNANYEDLTEKPNLENLTENEVKEEKKD